MRLVGFFGFFGRFVVFRLIFLVNLLFVVIGDRVLLHAC